MVLIWSAIVVLASAIAINTMLTIGLYRRLKSSPAADAPNTASVYRPRIGQHIEEFSSVTHQGVVISSRDIAEGSIFAFFMPDCGPCVERLPSFVNFVRENGHRKEGVIAVIMTDLGSNVDDLISEMAVVAQVVIESDAGPILSSFKVRAFPSAFSVERDSAGRMTVASTVHF